MVRTTGYSVRVWMALRSVRAVQQERGRQPILLAFESLRDWLNVRAVRRLRREAEQLGIQLVCVPMWPKKAPLSTWLNWRWGAALVRRVVRTGRIGVVHAQSHIAAGACARALRGRPDPEMVFDVHGVDIEEALADGRLQENSFAHQLRKQMLQDALARTDWLLPVSQALASWVVHGAPRALRIRVVPCVSSLPGIGVDHQASRREARQRLGVGDRPVVLYLGGASPWQRPKFLVECFREARSRVPDAVMLAVTDAPDEFTSLLSAAGLPPDSYRVQSVPHAEVAGLAVAADVGLLIREDSLINRVASPTKFAEYLSLGIPVVLTDVLADFASLVSEKALGRVVPASASAGQVADAVRETLKDAARDGAILRDRCRAAAEEHLSFASAVRVYQEIYG